MPLNIVVDANVVIKAYIPETLSERTESLFIKVEKTGKVQGVSP